MRYLAYKIVEEVNHERFERAVTDLMQQGWEPHGQPIILPRHDNEMADSLYQAMVRLDHPAAIPATAGPMR